MEKLTRVELENNLGIAKRSQDGCSDGAVLISTFGKLYEVGYYNYFYEFDVLYWPGILIQQNDLMRNLLTNG